MDRIDSERAGAIALGRVFGSKPALAKRLVESLGSAREVFSLGRAAREAVFGPFSRYAGELTPALLRDAEREYDRLRRLGYACLAFGEPSYPALLSDTPDAPAVLYLRCSGDPASLFGRGPAVAVVGTRDVSPRGRDWCRRLVKAFSESGRGPAVISGLALGVDGTAHRTALECGLPTIAVLPVGIEDVYPRVHRELSCLIASAEGSALVSDFPPGTVPTAFNFLRRNRIIAGLSDAAVVVESKRRGGAMVTARLASDYSREVFVLPGRVDDPRSEGCNMLISEKLAEIVVSVPQLCLRLGLKSPAGVGDGRSLREKLTGALSGRLDGERLEKAIRLAEAVRSSAGADYETLCRTTGMEYREVAGLCALLENEGVIETDLLQRCTLL